LFPLTLQMPLLGVKFD